MSSNNGSFKNWSFFGGLDFNLSGPLTKWIILLSSSPGQVGLSGNEQAK